MGEAEEAGSVAHDHLGPDNFAGGEAAEVVGELDETTESAGVANRGDENATQNTEVSHRDGEKSMNTTALQVDDGVGPAIIRKAELGRRKMTLDE